MYICIYMYDWGGLSYNIARLWVKRLHGRTNPASLPDREEAAFIKQLNASMKRKRLDDGARELS